MLRKTYGYTGAEVRGDCMILHNEMHHDFYVSPNIILLENSRRMRWAEHVARMERRVMYIVFW